MKLPARLMTLGPAAVLGALLAGCSALPGLAGPSGLGHSARQPVVVERSVTTAGPGGDALLDLPAVAGTVPGSAAASAGVSSSLTGAVDPDEVEPEVVYLPELSSWPRFLRFQGPTYALVQLEPYVGQFGILKDYERASSGLGYGIVVGYRMPRSGGKSLGFEGILSRSGHDNETSNVDGTAMRMVGAARMSFNVDEKLIPFVVGGVGRYSLEFDKVDAKYHLSGLGGVVGGGVEYSVSGSFSARAELCLHIWDAAQPDGNGGMAETLVLGLGAAMSF